ncbi:hypothetical protein [Actinoplanes sp. NPDC051494]|uniref:hypothetical protein n=1 Tax=Actinoplanes sp. NPDC051494 TaxID=3363907 RepID=UPI0037B1652E
MSYRIEDVLEAVQQGAPAPRTSTDDIIAGARRIRSRRRWAAGTAAGGAVLTVAVLVAGLTGTPQKTSPPVTPAAPTVTERVFTQPDGFAATLGEYRVGRYTIGPVDAVTQGYQTLPVYRDGDTTRVGDKEYLNADAVIRVYRPGVYDPRSFGAEQVYRGRYGRSTAITVAGRPGMKRELTYEVPTMRQFNNWYDNPTEGMFPEEEGGPEYTRTAVAWEYADDAWAVFAPGQSLAPMSEADTLAMVAGLTPAQPRPIRVPYRIGYLPDGYQVVGALQVTPETDEIVSIVSIHRGPLKGDDLVDPMDEVSGGLLRIWQGTPTDSTRPATKTGVRCDSQLTHCVRLFGDDNYFAEFQSREGGLPEARIKQILSGLSFENVNDRSTWQPVG